MWPHPLLPAAPVSCTVPQGHVYRSSTGKLERWFNPNWIDLSYNPTQHVDLPVLKQTFIDAVVKRLMSDAPLAILLSGGLDSSLVASVAVSGAAGGPRPGRRTAAGSTVASGTWALWQTARRAGPTGGAPNAVRACPP